MENKYSLYHFGVKGMRWGRRKGRNTSDSRKEKLKKVQKNNNYSDDDYDYGAWVSSYVKANRNAKISSIVTLASVGMSIAALYLYDKATNG